MRRSQRPWVLARAAERPLDPAVSWDGRETTWAELATGAAHCAARLRALGVRPGTRVALLMSPSLRWVELAHAVAMLGATVVPLNTRLAGAELGDILARCRPRVLLHDAGSRRAARDATELAGEAALEPIDAVADLDRVRPRVTEPEPPGAAPMTILYTSGTTGRSKGVVLTRANHEANAAASERRLSTTGRDRWLLVLPPYHVGGLAILLRAAMTGSSVVVHDRFDVVAVHHAIYRQGVTGLSVVPTMLLRMLEEADARRYPPSLRCVLVGGGPISAPLIERALRRRVPIACTYGLTEAASQVCTGWVARERAWAADTPSAHHAAFGWAGPPLHGTELRIEAPASDGVGEILVRAPSVMQGYLDEPEETARVLRAGWLHTGDLGRLDERGHLWLAARRSDLVVSGGENVYPAEVEAVLQRHPHIREAAVYGEPDAEWGQRVCAAIVTADPTLDASAVGQWCLRRLAGFKVPRVISVVDELPHTASGKIERSRLASLAARGRRSERR